MAEERVCIVLGDLYVSDFVKDGEKPRGGRYELKLVLDEYGAAKLSKVAPLDTMYGKYWFKSGTNATIKDALRDIVTSINNVYNLSSGDVWLDIACNDGTLLSYVQPHIIRIGIDPCDDSYRQDSEKVSDLIIQDYFSADSYFESMYGFFKANVITSIAMFYDVENRDKFLMDIYEILEDDGLWVLQLSYTPLMLKQLAFDNICHEHLYYYSLLNLQRLLNKHGFKIMDCQLNDINGGSFRLYVMKDIGNEDLFATQPYRDVCEMRINSLASYELGLDMDCICTWRKFEDGVRELKEKTVSFINKATGRGKIVMGYGASTKGNTLLQYFGLDNTMVKAIADRNPQKHGLRTVGTNIPIVSEEEMRKVHPDYLLILPWHFINEFKEREIEYLEKGGRFIVPCPKFEII